MGGALAADAAAVEIATADAEEVPAGIDMESDHEGDNNKKNDDCAKHYFAAEYVAVVAL